MTKNDSESLWRWRNHSEVRKWCFDTAKINYITHKKWFDRKVKEEATKVYIAENEAMQKIGQVRFDIYEGNKAYINVNLNPDFFTKGLGNKVIKLGTEFFLGERKTVGEVKAEIVKENIASKKSFEKAGYSVCGEKNKKGRQVLILSYKGN